MHQDRLAHGTLSLQKSQLAPGNGRHSKYPARCGRILTTCMTFEDSKVIWELLPVSKKFIVVPPVRFSLSCTRPKLVSRCARLSRTYLERNFPWYVDIKEMHLPMGSHQFTLNMLSLLLPYLAKCNKERTCWGKYSASIVELVVRPAFRYGTCESKSIRVSSK
jgi:hypothetical protein